MSLKLVKLSEEYKTQLADMIDEWSADIEKNHTNHSPWAIFRNDYHNFEYYLENIEGDHPGENRVPDRTFFCLDEERNIFVGAVNIRLFINDDTYLTGGHIGDGVRPSERRKGYATKMIGLALEECRKLGLYKVLMTCTKGNIGSEKSIKNNGGVLESEVIEDGAVELRYWITVVDEKVETDRLIMRRVMPSDVPDMGAWTTDARVSKYLLRKEANDPMDILDGFRRKDPNSKENILMIERSKDDNRAMGLCGAFYNGEEDVWELAYTLRYDEWGKGYTTEACRALIDYVSKNFGAHSFRAECAKENVGSSKVLKKLGMAYSHDSSYSKKDGSATFESEIYVLKL